MKQPLVSIIMPMYGVERYIAKAIESVLRQHYTGWELVIVNDGTEDNSRRIAEEYEKKDSRIIIVDKPNGGLSDARNFGLQFVHGKYLHFFDSDDYIDEDFYDSLVNHMERHDFDFVITGYTTDFYNSSGEIYEQRDTLPEAGEYGTELIRSNYHACIPLLDFAWNKFYKTSFITDNHLLFRKGLSLIEDAEFMNRVFRCSLHFSFIPLRGYHYCNYNRPSLSNTFSSDTITLCAEKVKLVKERLEVFGLSGDTEANILSETAFGNYKFIFYLLFNSNETCRGKYIREALYNGALHSYALNHRPVSMFDKLVLLCIRLRKVWIVSLTYQLKRYIKSSF